MIDLSQTTNDDRIAFLTDLMGRFYDDMEGADYDDFIEAESGFVACSTLLKIYLKNKEEEKS